MPDNRTHLIHRKIRHSLSEGSTWAAMAGTFAGGATQVPSPWSIGFVVAAIFAGLMGALLRDKGAS